MDRPRILVTTAAGKTGRPVALQLLKEGFPVTAFVRQEDARSATLKAAGADIVIGSLTDFDDLSRAMSGASRAYFNTPFAEGNLTAAAVFATAAARQKLEVVVAMSQWLANSRHPSVHTREVWLADRLMAMLPNTAVTTINVGFFADNDMQTLAFAAQFGRLMLPYGHGRNAPPSNEDIGAVAAAILARPEGHAGKTYRPTGPVLLSPEDTAAAFSRALGREVRYVNAPLWMVRRLMNGMGFSPYAVASTSEYYLDYQQDAFAVGAPTDVVRTITGCEPEDIETIARRYVASMPNARASLRGRLRLMLQTALWLLRPMPRSLPRLSTTVAPEQRRFSLSANSPEWLQAHGPA